MNKIATGRKAVFLDKDGTLVTDVPFNVDPKQIRLNEGTVEGLRMLSANGYLLIVISNQSGIAHGYFDEDALELALWHLRKMLVGHSIEIDAFYWCPHHPKGSVSDYSIMCDCRKPKPGLFFRAANEFDIDLSASWMIGDILHDVEAGHAAGCKSILIVNGNETEWNLNDERYPDLIAFDILDAAISILNQEAICMMNS